MNSKHFGPMALSALWMISCSEGSGAGAASGGGSGMKSPSLGGTNGSEASGGVGATPDGGGGSVGAAPAFGGSDGGASPKKPGDGDEPTDGPDESEVTCPRENASAPPGVSFGVVRIEFQTTEDQAQLRIRNFTNGEVSIAQLVATNKESGGSNWFNSVPRVQDELQEGGTLLAPLNKPKLPSSSGELALFNALPFDASTIESFVSWSVGEKSVPSDETFAKAAQLANPPRWPSGESVLLEEDSAGMVAIGDITDPASWVAIPAECLD